MPSHTFSGAPLDCGCCGCCPKGKTLYATFCRPTPAAGWPVEGFAYRLDWITDYGAPGWFWTDGISDGDTLDECRCSDLWPRYTFFVPGSPSFDCCPPPEIRFGQFPPIFGVLTGGCFNTGPGTADFRISPLLTGFAYNGVVTFCCQIGFTADAFSGNPNTNNILTVHSCNPFYATLDNCDDPLNPFMYIVSETPQSCPGCPSGGMGLAADAGPVIFPAYLQGTQPAPSPPPQPIITDPLQQMREERRRRDAERIASKLRPRKPCNCKKRK